MTNTVISIMSNAVTSVTSDYDVEDIEKIMDRYKISCLPVSDDVGRCIGIISEADLIHCHNSKNSTDQIQARDICTQPVVEITPNTSVTVATNLMLENNIHHLVVVSNDTLVGILSSMDLLAYFAEGKGVL